MNEDILYAPILKCKKGERVALQKLDTDTKAAIRPIIEVVDQADADNLFANLASCFCGPIYLDTAYEDNSEREMLRDLIQQADTLQLEVRPVLYYEDLLQPELVNWANRQEHICLRIPVPEDIQGPDYNQIFTAISALNSDVLQVDLMLDLGPLPDKRSARLTLLELKTMLIGHVISNNVYSSIIIASTCFPESLQLDAGESRRFDRFELKLFQKLLTYRELQPIIDQLVFADYGVTKFTETDLDFSMMRYGPLPKIRYTTSDSYWVLKGKKDRQNNVWVKSVFDMAKEVCDSPDFYGEDFSYGDEEIMKRALRAAGPGNNAGWVTIAVNHHITVVVDELSNPF
jgi:hypothetical protein